MKILGSYTSPFVRVVRVLCEELKCDYELDVLPPFPKMTSADIENVKKANPLMKIPVLIDGDQSILDSRIISNYLLKNRNQNNPLPENTLDDENDISVIYGAIDAGILRFIMGNEGLDLNSGYMKKSLDRIKTSLEYLEQSRRPDSKKFGFFEIALICGLDWFALRNIFDWSNFENLQKIHAQHKDRSSFIKTRPPL